MWQVFGLENKIKHKVKFLENSLVQKNYNEQNCIFLPIATLLLGVCYSCFATLWILWWHKGQRVGTFLFFFQTQLMIKYLKQPNNVILKWKSPIKSNIKFMRWFFFPTISTALSNMVMSYKIQISSSQGWHVMTAKPVRSTYGW